MMEFCPDELFNVNQTWNTEYPRLSSCLTDAVLTVIPLAWLLISSVFIVLTAVFGRSNRGGGGYNNDVTKLAKTKILLTLVLIFNLVCEDGLRNRRESRFASYWIHLVGSLVSYAVCILNLVFREARKNKHGSKTLFYFWVLMLPLAVSKFQLQIEDIIDGGKDFLHIFVICTFCPLVIAQLILACLSHGGAISCFSGLTFAWLDSLIWKGYRSPITLQDVPQCPPELDVNFLAKTAINNRNNGGLKRVLFRSFGHNLCISMTLVVVQTGLLFAGPPLVKLLVRHIDTEDEETWKGFLFAAAIFASTALCSVLMHQLVMFYVKSGVQMQAALTSMVFRKAMRLSTNARQRFTSGEILNLVSVDAAKLTDLTFMFILVTTPVRIVLSTYLLYAEVGPLAFFALAVFILIIPYNVWFTKFTQRIHKRIMEKKAEY